MLLRFVRSESTFSYFDALHLYFAAQGRPVAFYFDKHTVFHVANQFPKSGRMMTQFGRALNTLKMKIFCANSPQAKGRVERANRTLQDRLVKELRLANNAQFVSQPSADAIAGTQSSHEGLRKWRKRHQSMRQNN